MASQQWGRKEKKRHDARERVECLIAPYTRVSFVPGLIQPPSNALSPILTHNIIYLTVYELFVSI